MRTILILDDNPVVLQMLGVVLRAKTGYRVLQAVTEEEAISQFEWYREEIDLLVADACVEDRPGRAVADRLRRLCPQLRVLFISGYPKDHLVESGWLQAGDHFLAKPFPPERLMHCVSEVLASSCQPQPLNGATVRAACAGGAA